MVAGFEPFLLSAVPGDIASGLGAAVVASGVAMWRRIVNLEERNRIDREELLNVARDGIEAQRDIAEVGERLIAAFEDLKNARLAG